MIALGCLIRLDPQGKTYKAKGPVRINGLDWEAVSPGTDITFDKTKKIVKFPISRVWMSRGDSDKRWLYAKVPGFQRTYAGRVQRFTLALGFDKGRYNLNQTANATLYGFPAHGPAFEFEQTAGRTAVKAQLSLPPRKGAKVDPVTGLWKAP